MTDRSAARALAEWQAQKLEGFAAALRLSGVPLQARGERDFFRGRYPGDEVLPTLERLFYSTDDDLKKAYEEEVRQQADRQKRKDDTEEFGAATQEK